MQNWFIHHGMHSAYFSDDILKFPTSKPPAFLTIDDRAICFNGRFPTSDEMLNFQSWQRRDVAGNPTFGPTGQFPDGKINPEDEGELQLGIAHDQDNVIINFGKPVEWLAFPPAMARQMAQTLLKHANAIRE